MFINFIIKKNFFLLVSFVLVLLSVFCISLKHLNLGIDFVGGVRMEVGFINKIDYVLLDKDIKNIGINNFIIDKCSDNTVVIKLLNFNINNIDIQIYDYFVNKLSNFNQVCFINQIEYVGPLVGKKFIDYGFISIILTFFVMFIYVFLRFNYKLAISAIVALLHDIIIIIGVLSFFYIEFDLSSLSAILAIIGYSINDTIIIYDRIRENINKKNYPEHSNIDSIVNFSINQTLSRTLITSFSTLFVTFSLLIFGSYVLYSFSLILCIGILVGTYSSIYVATSFSLFINLSVNDFEKYYYKN